MSLLKKKKKTMMGNLTTADLRTTEHEARHVIATRIYLIIYNIHIFQRCCDALMLQYIMINKNCCNKNE